MLRGAQIRHNNSQLKRIPNLPILFPLKAFSDRHHSLVALGHGMGVKKSHAKPQSRRDAK